MKNPKVQRTWQQEKGSLKMVPKNAIYVKDENKLSGYTPIDEETEARIWNFIGFLKDAKVNGESGQVSDQTGLRIFMAVSEYLLKHDGKKHPLFAYPKKGGVSMTKRGGLPIID